MQFGDVLCLPLIYFAIFSIITAYDLFVVFSTVFLHERLLLLLFTLISCSDHRSLVVWFVAFGQLSGWVSLPFWGGLSGILCLSVLFSIAGQYILCLCVICVCRNVQGAPYGWCLLGDFQGPTYLPWLGRQCVQVWEVYESCLCGPPHPLFALSSS